MSVNGIINIYKTDHREGDEWLQPVDSNDYDFLTVEGRPLAGRWKAIRMRRFRTKGGRLRRPCDFPYCAGGALAMTSTAKMIIGSVLQRYGEFLPLSCQDGSFWAFHVTHFVDALDENASDVERASGHPDRIIGIKRHAFRPERLTADWMFKLPQFRGRGPTYVTDPFVNMIRTSGLTGLEFKRIWPHS
jgi:hypothetical protein